MSSHFVTYSAREGLILPDEAKQALGLHPGTRLSLTVEEDTVTLKRMEAHPLSQERVEKAHRAMAELRGMFRGQPSLEDELDTTRREEEEHAERKYGV